MKAKLLTFLLGLVLGVLGAIFVPRLLEPLLPAGLRASSESVEGTVIRRQRDEQRLLLTINTPQGAALATFTEKVAEIDLLVEEGDAVTLDLGTYEPFVDNPLIRAVRKADLATAPAGGDSPTAEPEDALSSTLPAGPPEGVAPDAEPTEASGAEPELEEWPGGGTDG